MGENNAWFQIRLFFSRVPVHRLGDAQGEGVLEPKLGVGGEGGSSLAKSLVHMGWCAEGWGGGGPLGGELKGSLWPGPAAAGGPADLRRLPAGGRRRRCAADHQRLLELLWCGLGVGGGG